jgi:ribose transport system ATP-binding protein
MEEKSMSETLLKFNNITKLFPGVVALDDVSVEFEKGEVHAICGENGAGKSTLIKILTGAYMPTSGTIEFNGKTYDHFNPKQAIDLGISAIYQEFNLVPFLSVAENVFFGNEIKGKMFLNKREMHKCTKKLALEMGVDINPKTRIKDLGVAYAQITEIIKAISHDAKLLVMDEPSAPLTNREIDAMFEVISRLKKKGITIIYISHRMEEIFEVCDRVTVMRDGKYVSTRNVSEVKGLTNDRITDVSFKLHKGEILGLGGLVGAGRTETARAVFGADKLMCGEIFVKEERVKILQPKDAIKHGIGLLPEDRKGEGLVLGMTVRENITYSILNKLTKHIFINRSVSNKMSEAKKDELSIKTPSINQLVKFLSGGNQQKVVLAKWLVTNSDILMFDEPTRGIDVGTKQEIYALMHRLTEQGKSIIMISSEMPELLGMSDRVLIMREGRIRGELLKDEFNQETVLRIASGL